MSGNAYAAPISQSLKFLGRTCSVFQESDSEFTPSAGQFTVAQQIAHIAQTIDWFMVGGFGSGFDLDFAAHHAAVRDVHSLADAFKWLADSMDNASAILSNKTQDEMMTPIPAGPIMAGEPHAAIVGAIAEHTAHHRGSLAVYARLLGYEPPIPYTE